MQTMTLEINDDFYEEFMAMIDQYIKSGQVKIIDSSIDNTMNNDKTNND